MVNLGISDPGINYEVALEALGQGRQPLMVAIGEEKAKATPSAAFIKFCEMRLAAIDELQDELRPDDISTIAKILQKDAPFFRV